MGVGFARVGTGGSIGAAGTAEGAAVADGLLTIGASEFSALKTCRAHAGRSGAENKNQRRERVMAVSRRERALCDNGHDDKKIEELKKELPPLAAS